MKLSYIISLSLKNLKGHKMRTFLTMGGVAISVGFVIFLVSLGVGLQRVSTTQITNLDALEVIDVTLGKSKVLTIDEETLEKFKNLGGVETVEPQVSLASQFSVDGSQSEGIVYGSNTELISLAELKTTSGRFYTSNGVKEAVINTSIKNAINGDAIGKTIKLTYAIRPELIGKDAKVKVVTESYKIVGVIEDKNAPYLYIPLEMVKTQGITSYTGAKIKMDDKSGVDQAKLKIENLGFKATSIKETIDQINQFFGIFQIILISFGGIAVVVACMGMFNTLTISLLEKTREVGFMKALGTTRSDVYRLFIIESLLIGVLGSILGVVSGTVIGWSLNVAILGFAKATGNQPVEIFYTPLVLVVIVLLISTVISFLTGFYPAKRAAKINPLDALRYE